jgi:hypothetical protein
LNSDTFRNPPREFQELPFWSWNDRLERDELLRQIGLMDEGGWGGFFMHSRAGLRTPYLGSDWLACVRACVEEARARGLQACLYDEDKWPSGYAGGLSVAANPEYRAKCLVCKVDDRPNLLAERIATFWARERAGMLQGFRLDPVPILASQEDRIVQFYPLTMALGNPTFNDYAYVDLLNADAVAAFLDSTHAVYARHLGAEFGKTIPALFTDEPCFQFPRYTFGEFGYRADDLAIPWTQDLPNYFLADNGYDLLPQLPGLFFDTDEYQKVRYDFYRTVTRMFTERYTKQLYHWCEQHGLKLTGHLMGEDTLLWQIPWVGSVMPHLAWMHIPGVDKLGRNVNGFDSGMVLTMKQLDSVVCQTGKPRALCENYGCSGQDFAHTGRKWIGDWAYVLGVNLNNPHMALYSMRGERKRDCPQNLFFQQPWWPENRLIADYFARLSYALSQGERRVDILVIHPIRSAWAEYRPGASAPVIRLDQALNTLLLQLMQNQRDFHLGDEGLMERGEPCEAHVATGEGGPRFVVGRMAYRVVIVPPSITLAQNTARLLAKFSAAGGTVLALAPPPARIDGRVLTSGVVPANTIIVSDETLPAVLDRHLPFDIRVTGHPEIWAHHREAAGRHVYFLANIDPDRGCQATVQVRGRGRVEEWNAATGTVFDLPGRTKNDVTEIDLDFPPAGSHLFIIDQDQMSGEGGVRPEPGGTTRVLNGRWHIGLDDPNALVLDTAQIRIEGMDWSPPLHILDAQQIACRAGSGAYFHLKFEFDVAEALPGPIALVIEAPDQFGICVNGQEIDGCRDEGWWIDPAFRRLAITQAVRVGRNEVLLSGTVTRTTELESIYIIGDFGVTSRWLRAENRLAGQVFDRYGAEYRLRPLPDTIGEGDPAHPLRVDLTASGFPFFAGRITLEQKIWIPVITPDLHLEIDQLHAALVEVKVNGQRAGMVAWPPHRITIADFCQVGENTIAIELVGTLRNLLGPHHLAGGDPNRTNPEQFRDKTRWTDDTILTPFGWDQVRLCW